MDKLIIEKSPALRGTVRIGGAKNAALPILAATLLNQQPCTLTNLPQLQDVTTFIQMLAHLGSHVLLEDQMRVTLDTSQLHTFKAPYDLVKTMRASFLLLGPLLARHGQAMIDLPGGCAIGLRPVDLHIDGLRKLGAELEISKGCVIATCPNGLTGCHIHLDVPTVTGTENLMMAATLARGTTVIYGSACEPEIEDLAHFINAMGGRIEGAGTPIITIEGVASCDRPVEHAIIPDRIEAGTYLTAAAMTQGCVTLEQVNADHLTAVIDALKSAGADITIREDSISLSMTKRPRAISVSTAPYPGFPTDMQAQWIALNTIADGEAHVRETIFENRFMHVQELQRLGAHITLHEHTIHITGKAELEGAHIKASDLRASACLVLAGLVAQGQTTIHHIYHMDRGYEYLENKLSLLGAHIMRAPDLT